MQSPVVAIVTGADIYQHGIFKSQTIEILDNPTSVTSKENKVNINGFEERTQQIPAELGKHFGIIYIVKGNPEAAKVPIRLTISHPPMKRPDSKEVYTSTDSMRSINIGAHEFHGWLFEHEWEIVPGQYIFQICYLNKKLAEKAFTVVSR